ncbi:bifunctional ADP-dependent NAD(P)H-hydrate dehydratase/NAD(P)H-hydrate epimerase [[Kitasatospora] papulosa]|uniref:Bifunctional NAD(P)H-hydrate repair enzyme n=3 Tax=Streptomyces TaxID=1883 RepID=A0A8D3WFJ6_STRFA|nr:MULTISPECIES: bifunctional ADP-dependent NAD(P)H-hydrate dehydratase/NAD(P)H-hydrate epimerase [unclassified Streptomyces]MDX2623565.1 bifunctional ADP-dependent NAD(P)H-hydrate dehydratase/NAD(P)H-hydrate epimerase [Streptomyces sp. WI03-5b]MEE1777760.1 bifunctional ADP-dependent NAD(P)H-hydrate dehydratase/NAD(P)H-hydrate epimerase [Streptomyces sp. JV181]MYT51297.1 bifunctional ADP-dependent NAD(P)H-hydrate dehydratase/NAD(P)H-hydrate epimerase [Streptomyces sp. SID7815]WKV78466.1 bifunct
MRHAYSVETVRAAERALMERLPEGALMQRAAAGLAVACCDLLRRNGRVYGSRVLLLVGSGDNGGDTLYAGARLARRGAGVRALLTSPDKVHRQAMAALLAAGGQVLGGPPLGALGPVDLVVDGITGIGGRGGLRPEAAELVRAVTAGHVPVLAVDLPSGVEADTGEVLGEAVHADATVTFGTYKPGLLVDPAAGHAGALRLVDIGLAEELPDRPDLEALQYADVAALLPVPDAGSDKYRRGVVGVAAGSERYPGAAVLAVAGALRGGAGAVRYAGPGADAVIARFPETLVHPGPPSRAGRVQAWVAGPGLGDSSASAEAVADVLAADVPVLVDADGLRLMDAAAVRARTAATVLTPHAGEAAALLGVGREEVEAGRLAAVRELAARYRATVLLKGSTTLVAEPGDAPVRVNPTGTSWLATAGSGDVLSGLTGSLLAAGLAPRDAASVGAYLHGLAARRAADGAPVAAQDVADAVPAAWRDVLA